MARVDANGDGFTDMDTDAFAPVSSELSKLATDFATAIKTAMSEMDTLESRLGQGPMGREFAANYREPADWAKRRAAWLANWVEDRGTAATVGHDTYTLADEISKRGLDSV